jgi:hypothetical protein
MAETDIQLLQPGGVNWRGEKGEKRGVLKLLIGGFGATVEGSRCAEVGEWARERSWLGVREGAERWGPPVRDGKEKERKKEKRGEGCAGCLLGCCPELA